MTGHAVDTASDQGRLAPNIIGGSTLSGTIWKMVSRIHIVTGDTDDRVTNKHIIAGGPYRITIVARQNISIIISMTRDTGRCQNIHSYM